MTERSKIIRLTLLVPWLALALTLVSLHLHGIALWVVVILFVLAMAALLAYVVPQMVKAKKRSTR
jgi:O-antigen/teichoic acid export membrane protein